MPTLSNSQLPEKLTGVVDGTIVVDSYVHSIQIQPDIKLPSTENLPAHQALARKHAKFWQDDVKPEIQRSIDDTIHFSQTFLGKYQTLESLIQKLQNGDGNAKTEFIKVVDSLKMNLSLVAQLSEGVRDSLGKFGSLLNQDLRNFQHDSQEAQVKIVGDSKELKSLSDQLHAINKAIDRDRGLIAGGIICFWLAVGGGIDLDKQEKAKDDVNMKIALKKQELMALNAAKQHIDGFVVSINPVSQAASTLHQAWASLVSDFGEVTGELKDLSTTDAVAFLKPILETAKEDWKVVLDKTEQLKPKLSARY